MNAGKRIRERMKELGIKTTTEAAALVGLSRQFLGEVLRGDKELGFESAIKIANGLNIPLAELSDEAPEQQVDRAFWRIRFSELDPSDLVRLSKRGQEGARLAWTIAQAKQRLGPSLPNVIGTSPDHVERMLAGGGTVTETLRSQMNAGLHLPPHWLDEGRLEPSELQANKLLNHRYAQDWLEFFVYAIDNDVTPQRMKKLLDAYLDK